MKTKEKSSKRKCPSCEEEWSKKIKSFFKKNAKEHEEGCGKKFGHLVGFFINLVMIYVVNKVPEWNIAFITDDFKEVLPVLNVTLIASAVINLALVIYRGYVFYQVLNIIENLFSIAVMITMLSVWPFDFREIIAWESINTMAKIVSGFIIFALIISIFVRIAKAGGHAVGCAKSEN